MRLFLAMPVNGLLVNFSRDSQSIDEISSQLELLREVSVGELIGRSLPIVVECDSSKESKMIHRRIEGLDDVVSVDVIFASVE